MMTLVILWSLTIGTQPNDFQNFVDFQERRCQNSKKQTQQVLIVTNKERHQGMTTAKIYCVKLP